MVTFWSAAAIGALARSATRFTGFALGASAVVYVRSPVGTKLSIDRKLSGFDVFGGSGGASGPPLLPGNVFGSGGGTMPMSRPTTGGHWFVSSPKFGSVFV